MSELERVLKRLARLLQGEEEKPSAADCGEQLQIPTAQADSIGGRPTETAPDLNDPGAAPRSTTR
jgi:hypothetical protein